MYTTIEYEVWRKESTLDTWHVYLYDQLLATITKSEHGFFQVDKDEDMYLWPKFDLALFWAIRCSSVVLATAAYRRQHGRDDTAVLELGEI
jgi:hypothetical protein